MNQKEKIRKLIESIGFIDNNDELYKYKEFEIDLWSAHYYFYNGSELIYYDYNDLTPILKLTRSIKLKSLLR